MKYIFKIENTYIVPYERSNRSIIKCKVLDKKKYEKRAKRLAACSERIFQEATANMTEDNPIIALEKISHAYFNNSYFLETNKEEKIYGKFIFTDKYGVLIRYTKDDKNKIKYAEVNKIFCYPKELRDVLVSIYGYSFKITHSNYIFGNNLVFETLIKAEYIKQIFNKNVYHSFTKVMKNGKVRTFYEPFVGEGDEAAFNLKESYKELNEYLYNKYGNTNDGIQIAYKKGKNIVDNALPHKDHKYVFKADISDFFPSCKKELVRKKIEYLFPKTQPNREKLINIFLDNLLVDGGLCLGNPVSSTLANAIVAGAARYMYNMCAKSGIAFTQYSDDITMSSDRPIAKQFVLDIFNEAYTHCGIREYFNIKDKKLIGQVGQYRNVCGIAFDHTNNNKPTIRRGMWKEIRVKIHKLSLGQAQNMQKLKGQINFMKDVGQGQRVINYLNKFPGLNERYNLINIATTVAEEGEGNEEN